MAEEPKTEQEVVEIFQRLMEQRDSLSTAAIERRSDIAEHDLVIKTLEKVDDDRRCHRLIGDVMVERSKKTVLPEVVENRNNLAALVKTYEEKLEEKQREVLTFQKKYNIRIKGDDSAGPAKADKKAAPMSQGVLVHGTEPEAHPSWEELLGPQDGPDAIGHRARSASDANVLRRKGHLKEQDVFINFMQEMHKTHSCREVMRKVDGWIQEHRRNPHASTLRRLVPDVGSFFTPLSLEAAFEEYDEFFALSRRVYVPPNFAELRHILNIAQVHGIAPRLKLTTFDADGTLYADGAHMAHDDEMVRRIIDLMCAGVHVAIVTAAGYPDEPERFEERFRGLLDVVGRLGLDAAVTDRFHIMGGECNYLLRLDRGGSGLAFVPDAEWKSSALATWREDDVGRLLDDAEALLRRAAARLRLPVRITRKPRAVGVTPTAHTIYEVLEDLALSVRAELQLAKHCVPHCCFNGGNDVFVDVGNKSLGLEALSAYVGAAPGNLLHVGDRFTLSGNDVATRDCGSILWVANPEETDFFIKLLLSDLDARGDARAGGRK